MKKHIIPKNKNITVRVTRFEKFEYKQKAEANDLSLSEWANIILKNNKNNFEKKKDESYITEVIDNLLSAIKTMTKDIISHKRSSIKFSDKEVSLQILEGKIFVSEQSLISIRRRLEEYDTD